MSLETLFRIARWRSEGLAIENEQLVCWASAWARWIYRK